MLTRAACIFFGLLATICSAATFSDAGTSLSVNLASSDILQIVSNGTSYSATLASSTWSGSNSTSVSGNGTSTLTITSSGIQAFSGGISITNTGGNGNETVNFLDSGNNFYNNGFSVVLNVSGSGQIQFSGNTRFGTTNSLTVYSRNFLSLSANLSADRGSIALSSAGNLFVTGSVVSGSNTVSLAADVTAGGTGDDGIGTLTIGANATVNGTTITLRGADVDIGSGASVGSAVAPANVTTFATGAIGPFSFAFDSTGNLYVATVSNNQIAKFDPTGTLVNANYIIGLSNPTFIAIDASDNLFVSNQTRHHWKYNSTGTAINASFITGLNTPLGIAFDSGGHLYVCAYGSNAVVKYDSSTAAFLGSFSSSQPAGIALDSAGNVYIQVAMSTSCANTTLRAR